MDRPNREDVEQSQERPELRTSNSRTYATGNGEFSQVIYPGAINFQDASGQWQPIDNTLVAGPGGSGIRNKANRYQLQLPSTLAAAPVRVTSGGAWVAFALVGGAGKASISSDTAIYSDTARGVKVSFSARNDALKEAITLRDVRSPTTFLYALQTSPGLTEKASPSGDIEFLDSAGRLRFAFAPPFMVDSAGSTSRAATLTLKNTPAGQTVTLAADPGWLASKQRTWPVVIDPTLRITGALQDCSLVSGNFVHATSFCGQGYLGVGYNTTYETNVLRALLQFDLTGIPTNAQILSAELGLNLAAESTTSAAPVSVHRLTTAWTTGATWDSSDGTAPWTTPGGDFATAAADTNNAVGGVLGWYYWHPTQLVSDWVHGVSTNNGLLVKQSAENVVNALAFYDSSSNNASTVWPYLTVTYGACTVPASPGGVTATAGNSQATVRWTPPANGGCAITGYTITPYAGTIAGTSQTASATATSATVLGLTNGTTYTIRVVATNSVGRGPAGVSNAVTPAGVPAAPTIGSASAGNGHATVSWTAPASNGGTPVTGYVVTPYIGATAQPATTFSSTLTTQTVAGLTNGTAYTFTVAAINAAGTGPTSAHSNSVTPLGTPGPPTGVTATSGNAQATVSWTAPTSNGGSAITGYVVTPYVGSTAQTATSFNSTATTQTVTGLTNGTTYTFTVAAINAQGTGPPSTRTGPVTPASVPSAPTNVSATAGNGQATVTWTAPVSNGGSAITSYTVTPYVGTTAGTPMSVAATSTSTTVTGLINGTTYTFQVVATNAVGNSAPGISNAVTPGTPPGAPTNVTAIGGNAQATVSWTAPTNTGGNPITGYVVTPYIGSTAQTATTFNSTATTEIVTGLTNGTAYTFTVSAINALGTGPAPAPSAAVTPATVPGAPTGVIAVAGNQQATLSWTAPASNGGSPITGNVVTPYVGTTAQASTTFNSAATTQTVTGLTNGTAYTFTVAAINAQGTGAASAPSTAVTPATVSGAPTGVTATAGNSQATASWTAPTSNGGSAITGYVVTPYVGTTAQASSTFNSTATTQTVTGLTNGTAYTFTVAAINAQGTGAASAPSAAVTPVTVPGAPTGVTATAGNSQATVSWTAPTSNGGSAITGYVVTPYVGSTAQTPTTFNSTATTQIVTGLTNGTTYTFTVAAINAQGTGPASAPSAAVTPATVPGAPTGVIATSDNAQSTVSWTAPASNGGSAITGYVVTPYIGSTAQTATTFNSTATTQIVTGLTNGTAYTFTVSAINAVGTGPASAQSASVTPATFPGAPTNVTATAGNAQATVSWTAPASNGGSAITGYTVTPYVGTTAGTPSNVSASATSTTVAGLTNGTTYTFQVVARNSVGAGAAGTSNSVMPAGAPGAPTNVTATGGNAQATVSWTAPASNGGSAITSYTVTPYVGTAAGTPVSVAASSTSTTLTGLTNGTTYTFQVTANNALGASPPATSNAVTPATVPQPPGSVTAVAGNAQATVSWTAPANGGSAITGYTLTPYVGTTAGSAQSAAATATSATVTGLVNGTTYTFQVVATNAVGNSAPGTSNPVTPGTPPGAPTNVTATGGNAQATVSWTAPTNTGGNPITSYVVTPYVGSTAQTPTTFNSTATTQIVTGLTNGTTYTFTAAAINAQGTGPASAPSAAVTPATVPGAPTGVIATSDNAQSTVSWTAPASNGGSAITGYVVTPYIGSTAQTATTFNSTATTQIVTGLTNGTAYTFTVSAINAVGTGPASAQSASVTPATFPGAPTNVTATAGNAQATVSWTAPASNGGSAITGYVITPYVGTTAQTAVVFNSPATTQTVTGLTNGTTYTFQVAARNSVGAGPVGTSNAVTPATAPAAPTNVTATGGNAQATVSWMAPASNGGSAITSYVVTPYIGSTAQTATTFNSTATTQIIIGLTNGTAYTFIVAAINSIGTGPASAQSASVTPATVPGAPTSVTATAGNTQATLSWTAPASNGGSAITGFTVTPYVGTTAGTPQTAAATATNATVTGLVNGTTYTFQVVATNAVGAGPAGTSNSVVPTGAPGAPTNVTAIAGNAQATVSWTAPAASGGSPITGYLVTPYIGTTAQTATTYNSTATTQIVISLTNGTAYTFTVAAINASGTGPASGPSASVTPATVPGAPTNVTAIPGNAKATVSWTAPASNGGSAITGYTVTPYVGTTAGTPQTVPASATTATVTGLVNGTTYTFQVVATNSVGSGAAGTSGAVTPATVPAAPTNVTATSGNAQATVSWSAPASNGGSAITGYTVTPYLGATAGTPVTVAGSATTATVTGLTNGTTYTFQVSATNAMGNGPSAASPAVTVGTPGAPFAVTATAGVNQVTVSWTAPPTNASPITSYMVTAVQAGSLQYAKSVTPGASSVVLSSLPAGVTFTFQVVALNASGTGAAGTSNAVSATGTATTYASTVRADGTIAYYRLGDSGPRAADSSGNGYHGNLSTTGVASDPAAALGSDPDAAMAFSGGQIQTPYVQTNVTAYSIEAWVKTTSGASWMQIATDRGISATSGKSLTLGLNNGACAGIAGAPFFALDSDNTFIGAQGTVAINDGTWHHLVGVWSATSGTPVSASQFTVYVDGSPTAVTLCTIGAGTSPLTGLDGTRLGTGLTGSLDEVAIYPSALTQTQIRAHISAAGVVPATATNVVATAGANQATVTWTSPPNVSSLTSMVVTAYLGAQPVNAVGVAPTATAVTLSGLKGGSAYTFTVVSSNSFGTSPAATSNSVTPSGAATTYASTVLGDVPSIYYRLGEPSGTLAADSSGNGRNGNYQGAPYTLAVAGALVGDSDSAVTIQSNCCQIGGVPYGGSEVQYKLTAGLPSGNAARSVEVWTKSTNTATQGLVGWGNTGGLQGFQLALLNGNQISVTSGPNDSPLIFTSGYTIANGNWHLITATYDGTTLTVYLDGQSLGTGTFAGALTTSPSGFGMIVGHYFWGGVGFNQYNGNLDEVAVYGASLTGAQVLAHFNASSNSRPTAPTGVTATAGANQATVSWTASTASAGSPVSGYVVSANLNGTQSKNAIGVGGTTTSITLTGLQGSAAYTFTVTGYNNFGYGPASAPSASVTPTGQATTYASTVLGDSPSIYYRLGEPSGTLAADSSGNARNGYYQGTPYTLAVAGAVVGDSDPAVTIQSNCCQIGGVPYGGSEVQYKLTSGLPSGSAARSVEVWVKTTNTSTQGLVGWGNTGGLQAFQLALLNGNQISVTSGPNDSPLIFTSGYTIANGNWHLITATYDGTTLTVYLNGQILGTGTFAGALATSPSALYGLILGHYFWGGVGFNQYNGNLDEVAIYGASLTAAQVLAHFNASSNSRSTAPTGVTATAGVNQATVSWTAATASAGSPVVGYVVSANLNGTQSKNAIGVGGTTTSVTLTGLQGSAAYTFTVTAYNNFGYGPASAPSASVIPTGTATTYASTVLGDSPSFYYRLGEPSGTLAADSSGNSRNGYIQGTPYTLAVGGALVGDADPALTIQSNCCQIGGTPYGGSEVQYKLTSGLPSGNAARSIEVWVKTTNTGTQGLVGWGNTGGLQAFQLALLNGNQISITSGPNDTPLVFTSGYTIANGNWHLITVTYDGTTLTAYLNGQSLGTGTFTGALATSPTAAYGLILGHYFWCGVNCNQYNGNLDEVAVYGASFTAAQVLAHFNASSNSRPTVPTAVTATAGANQVTVSWTASTASVGSPVVGYVVNANLNGTQSQNAIAVGGGTTTTTITGLQGGSAYTFTVTAFNNFGYGPGSAASASVTPTGAASTYASTVLGNVPSVYYRLGDPSGTLAADSSGNGRNGYYQGTPYTLSAPGALVGDSDTAVTIQSNCCAIGGTPYGGSEVQYKLPTGLPYGNATRSIEVWVKTTNMGTQGLVGWGTAGTRQAFQLRLVGGNQIQIVSYSDDRTFTAASPIATGFWRYIVVTYDGTTVTAYLDGQSLGTTTFAGPLATTFSATGLILGHDVWCGVNCSQYNGSLDEVAVYSLVLTPAQVTAHYAASGNTQNIPGAPTGVSATGGVNQATVTWIAPSSTGGSPITGYTVFPHVGTTLRTPVTVSGTTTSTVISGLSGGTTYYFTVNASNANGTGPDSAPSNSVTPTGTVYPYAAAVLGDSPVGYWRFGEISGTSATDSSGNGNAGTYRGTFVLAQPGGIRNDPDLALTLDGSTAYVSVRSSATLNVTGGLSVEAWVKFSNTTGTQQIVNKGDGATASGTAYELTYISGTGVVFDTFVSGGGSGRATWRGTPQTGVWYYIAGSRTADGALALYVNTLLVGAGNDGGAALNNVNATVGLGASGIGTGANRQPFAGSLDEIAIYPSALSSTQVAAHWQASANRPGAPTNVVATASAPNQITVTWTAPTDPGSTAITGYVITPHVGATLATPTIVGAVTTAAVVSLSAGTSYFFTVAAINASGVGDSSVPSTAVTATGTVTYPYSPTVLADGPAANWRLAEPSGSTATDVTGNGNAGTYVAGDTLAQPGAIRRDPATSTQLDGTGGQVLVPNAAGLNITGDVTAEAWVKFNSVSTTQMLISKGEGTTSALSSFQLAYVANSGFSFTTFIGTTATTATYPMTAVVGTWYHVIGTRSASGVINVWVNCNVGSGVAYDSGGLLNNTGSVLAIGSAGSGTGSRLYPLNGFIQEAAVYNTSLTKDRVAAHYGAAGYVPAAPTNVSALGYSNSAVVTWTAPSYPGTSPISGYVITAYSGGTQVMSPMSVDANTTSFNFAPIGGGVTYTFTVTALNASGSCGPASTPSNAVSVAAPPVINLGQHLAIVTENIQPLPIGTFGFSTCPGQCTLTGVGDNVGPLSQWTIEGYIWGMSSNSVTGGNTSWGVLSIDRLGRPGNVVRFASPSRPIAGINFDIGARGGISSTLASYFVWPGGQFLIPSGSGGLPVAATGDAPAHFALSYDGTNVRGFINGALLFTTAASFGPITGPAGFMDSQEIRTSIFDEFRISNVARYTAPFTPTLANFNTDPNTTLLWHMDGFALGPILRVTVSVPFDCNRPQVYGALDVLADSAGPFPGNASWIGQCNFNGGPEDYWAYSVGQAPSAAETRSASNFKTTCDYKPFPVNCATGEFWHTFTDLSVPGRGVPLTLTRTYSSLHATTNGPLGYGWTGNYNMSLSIDSVTGNVTVNEENYSSVTFVNTGGSLQPPPRTLATLVRNIDGTYTFKRKSQVSYVFNVAGQLIREVDRNNYATVIVPDTSGRPSTVTDPAGRALTFTYTNGLLTQVTDSINRSVSLLYDACGQLTQATDVGGQVTKFTYETTCDNPAGGSSRRMLTMTDPRNLGSITNTYDGQGRVTMQTDQLNQPTKFAYSGGTTTITDPRGNITVQRYRDNLMFSQTKGYGTPQQATWTYTYDPITLGVASITDPNGHVATMRYDSRGNLVGATDPMGRSTSATYNAFNDPTGSIDKLGIPSTVAYDANGNLQTSSRPLQGSGQSATATFTYDPARPGDAVQMTDPNGKVWQYTYDQYGYQVSATDPLGFKATFVYDTIGRLVSSISPNGNLTGANPANFTTAYVNNAYGEVTSVTDQLGRQTTFTYDPDGNLKTVTDANLHSTTYTYDAANQLTLETRSDNSTRGFFYDLNGNVTQVKDGMQQPTNFLYDALDRATSMTDPLNRVTSYGYDLSGRVISVTDAMNRTTTLAYDSDAELVAVTYSDGITPNVHFAYDAMGRSVSMTDGSGTSTYSYDSLHRLVQATNGAGSAVGYGYDLNGHLTTITYPGTGRVVTNTYDNAGRLATVGDWLSHTTTFKYDANSNLVEQDYPNGVIASFVYDNADRLASLKNAVGVSAFLNLTYGRDNLGQLTSENSKTFGYDTVNRLTTALIGGTQSTYSYDNADRVTQVQVAAGSTSTYAYDAASQLQSLTTTQGGTQVQKYTYTYDPNGNRISRTDQLSNSLSYFFDQANHLTNLGSSAQYSYDGTGLRTQKNVGGAVTAFTWNLAAGLPTVLLEGQTAYLTGPGGLPLEQITSTGQVYYYHSDQLGSTRALTDSTGAVVQTYDYDAYGNPAASTGTITNPFRFGGQYTDAESGLQYLRARYYDPSSQSFISRDPALVMEPYSYAGGSPQSHGDPSGLDWADAARAGLDGTDGYLGYVPFLGIPLQLAATYSALRQCDFAKASEYMAGVAMNLMTGLAAGVLGLALRGVMKAEARAVRAGEGGAERSIVRGESKPAEAQAAYTKQSLAAARRHAVRQAWRDERALVEATGRGTRPWTETETAELLRTGKVKDYVGHHINSVKGSEHLAGEPNNIEFVTPTEHLARHGGNWRNPTKGELLDRSFG